MNWEAVVKIQGGLTDCAKLGVGEGRTQKAYVDVTIVSPLKDPDTSYWVRSVGNTNEAEQLQL